MTFMTILADYGWATVLIGGPIVLAAAMLFAKISNRNVPDRNSATEEGTRKLYRAANAEERAREDSDGS
jgi:hypothetical protein